MIITKTFLLSVLSFFSLFSFTIPHSELEELKNCGNNNICLQDFYTRYTLENGVEKSLQHFEKLTEKESNYISDCHYIFHGMGHGQYLRSGNDIGQAFAEASIENFFFQTLKTCGSGYYHGIIEEASENIVGKESLIDLLSTACNEVSAKGLDANNCFHGIGHAALIQLEGNIADSLYVCDHATENEDMSNSCHSGVFMEMSRDYEISDNDPDIGMLSLKACDSLPIKYQAECYNQQSYLFKEFSTNQEFIDNLTKCQEIEDQLKRIYCVRTFTSHK